jgi:eukaryotic-like serine/threonine-protein kinase
LTKEINEGDKPAQSTTASEQSGALQHGIFDSGVQLSDAAVGASPREPAASPEAAALLTEGSRFGGYLIGPCIGEGGMARIYRAEHEALQRQVALKVMTNGFLDTEVRERFVREARIAAAIKHRNVVNIFDVGVRDGVPFMVMELLEGEDLETLIQSKGAMDEDAIIDIMVPVVAGLTAVHDAGIVHRDLKPGNIFLTTGHNDEVEPKLLDFGISKSSCPKQFKVTTATGLLMGTPFYMPPEAIQGTELSSKADQYSLGVVMYECATGTNPFVANSFAEVAHRVISGTYRPLTDHNPRISKRLARIIARAMNLEPHRRYADMRELGRELLSLAGQRTRITWGLTFGEIAGSSLAPQSLGLSTLGTQAMPGKRTRAPVLGVLGAALIAGAVLIANRSAQGPEQSAATELASAAASSAQSAPLPVVPSEPLAQSAPALAPAEVEAAPEASPSLDPEAPSPRADAVEALAPRVRRNQNASFKPRATAGRSPASRPATSVAAPTTEPPPEWVLGDEQILAGQSRNVGTNNAPILD